MASSSDNRIAKNKRIAEVLKKKTSRCKVICICSFTSTLHLVVPYLKVLGRLGSVQVISEDRSLMTLSSDLKEEFVINDISVRIAYDLYSETAEDLKKSFEDFEYTILVVTDFVPDIEVDKYIMLTTRHYYREQIEQVDRRFTPIASVTNYGSLSKAEKEVEQSTIYVNEKLYEMPPYSSAQSFLSPLVMGVGKREFNINSGVANFVIKTLEGIEGCTDKHIRSILLERGELFVTLS